MSKMYNWRGFCIGNFPFLEKEFDGLTDYEIISKIFEHFENEIKRLEEKYNDILSIREDFDNFKNEVNQELSLFENNINESVNQKLEINYNNIVTLMSDYQTLFNSELNQLRSDLETEIQNIELGNVMAYNPTNGEVENVSKVIMDVYNTFRTGAITATEFDSLELSATEFDAYEITANEFDLNSKNILGN